MKNNRTDGARWARVGSTRFAFVVAKRRGNEQRRTRRHGGYGWLWLLLPLLSFVQPPGGGQTVPVDICDGHNWTFQPGERLTYKIYYNWNFVWVAAGEVTFGVDEAPNNQYHLSADGRTYAAYDWAFRVRDRYDTYIDRETLLPVRATKNLHEGRYTLYEDNHFDQTGKQAHTRRGRSRETVREDVSIDLSNCAHDLLSILYFTRNLDLNDYRVGAELPIELYLDKEVYPLKIRYRGREGEKKVRGQGTLPTHRLNPEVIAGGVFNEDAQMQIWVSDDQNQIPLLIESPIKVGSVKVVLKDYEGLLYETNGF